MNVEYDKNTLIFSGLKPFDLERSCFCGQAFRFANTERGIFGTVNNCGYFFRQEKDSLFITPVDSEQIPNTQEMVDYFDLARDYGAIEAQIKEIPELVSCIPYASGIRVFNQSPFETLISFIISANNNIKRISLTIGRLCEIAGRRVEKDGFSYYEFPDAKAVAALSVEQLTSIGTGYRAPYINRTATDICNRFELDALCNMKTSLARKKLCTLMGVGPKVADCVLLFSLNHKDAFPMDVWMNRAMRAIFFPNQEPAKRELEQKISELGECAGIIQQYIFHYARSIYLTNQ